MTHAGMFRVPVLEITFMEAGIRNAELLHQVVAFVGGKIVGADDQLSETGPRAHALDDANMLFVHRFGVFVKR